MAATIGAFQVGAFQPLPAYQQVQVSEETFTGGWKKKKRDYFPDELSPEERKARIEKDRILRGILEPKTPDVPKEFLEKPFPSTEELQAGLLGSEIDFARLELELIEKEMERAFPEPKEEMSDREVRERLLHALEFAQKRRMVLLLLLM